MPLAFLCHPYHRGGVTRWMVDAAVNWVERGYDCWFVAPRPRQAFVNGAHRPSLVRLIEAVAEPSRPKLVGPLVGSEFEFGTSEYRARSYARAVQGGVPPGVPIILSDDPSTWRAAELLQGRNPSIGVLHGHDPAYFTLANRFRGSTTAIVAVSHRVLARAQSLLGEWHVRAHVIPCGIPLPPVPQRSGGACARTALVWVGRISESEKRVSDLVEIARLLDARGFPFSLDIIGDGEDAEQLRRAVARAGLDGRIAFHGWLPSDGVWAVLGSSDIMILPSNLEGMPVAAMEALACGCAVVGSDSCGLEEYARHPAAKDALWIYARGDTHAAVLAITAAELVAREQRTAAARELARREFAIAVCMDRYEALLKSLPPAPVHHARVSSWHPADAMSRWVARARRGSAWLRRRLAADPRGSTEPIRGSAT